MGETVNPVTGLTQKEIQTVQDVWRMANQDRRELAYDLFDT
jgi:NADH:ubiquinone oxidoreductase subunit C